MDELKELVNILNRKRLTRIDVLDKTFLRQSNNLYYKLYDAIDKGTVQTDLQAAQVIYGKPIIDVNYRKLKSRFKTKLLKTILLLDPEDYFNNNEKTKAYYECLSALYTIEIIIKIKGVNKTVHNLIKDNYDKANEFKFYDILKTYSYYLLSYYSLNGDSKKYTEELLSFNKFVEYSDYELRAKQLNTRIMLYFSDPLPTNKNLVSEINVYLKEFSDIIEKFPDPESKFFYLFSLILVNEISAEYNIILDICDELEKLYNENSYITNKSRLNLVLLYRIKVLIHLKRYDEGIILFKKFKDALPDEGSINWFYLKESEFKLYLHSHYIPEAYRVYNEVTENKFFKRRFEHMIEKWKIYEAYLVFLDNYLNKGEYKFSIAKFMNEVSFYTKDKSGFNFSVRVIEILFLFAKKQYNVVFTKTDALKVYRTRYLNDDTYLRSRIFLSALIKAEKEGFIARIMKKGYPEIAQLKSKDQHFIISDWEVLPYEMVWDILVDLAKE